VRLSSTQATSLTVVTGSSEKTRMRFVIRSIMSGDPVPLLILVVAIGAGIGLALGLRALIVPSERIDPKD
jgi:hypothetical protein